MTIYIAILRGINVSGKRTIKMDALKKMCENLHFQKVKTYIQSGNIVFGFPETDTHTISEMLKNAIATEFGFDVPVITLSVVELANVIQSNPFSEVKSLDDSFFHITFLSKIPATEKIDLLKQTPLNHDKYEVLNKAVYLYCPDSYSNSKLSNTYLETKLKVKATTRNWKTANELLKIALSY